MFKCVAHCVWDLRALYKSLIQVFDFKANGDSSGGWIGGKMLPTPPPPLRAMPCISVWDFSVDFTFYYLWLVLISSVLMVRFLCFDFSFFHSVICIYPKRFALDFPKCLQLFLRRVCHSNVALRPVRWELFFGPLLTFVLLTLLHGLCHPSCVG